MQIARRVDAGEEVPEADYHLGFASTAALLEALTPARLALLDALKRLGPVPIERLAAQVGRSPDRVWADIARLLELELVEQDAAGAVCVPWDEIQIRLALTEVKAA